MGVGASLPRVSTAACAARLPCGHSRVGQVVSQVGCTAGHWHSCTVLSIMLQKGRLQVGCRVVSLLTLGHGACLPPCTRLHADLVLGAEGWSTASQGVIFGVYRARGVLPRFARRPQLSQAQQAGLQAPDAREGQSVSPGFASSIATMRVPEGALRRSPDANRRHCQVSPALKCQQKDQGSALPPAIAASGRQILMMCAAIYRSAQALWPPPPSLHKPLDPVRR